MEETPLRNSNFSLSPNYDRDAMAVNLPAAYLSFKLIISRNRAILKFRFYYEFVFAFSLICLIVH